MLGFPDSSSGKESPAMQETPVRFLGWEDPLEKGTATHSSSLVWRNSMDRGTWKATVHGGQKKSDTTEQLSLSLVAELGPGTRGFQ